ncbi:MAG: acyl-CoA dehydrogenase family protein [Deltaproteobacteria bacterium]|nr:acyl-CoA dehydrogenase family protein [Deltaproteobacteria bacterium]
MKFQAIDYAETDEHRMIRATARALVAEHLAPIAAALDREQRFPAEVVKVLGQHGLLGLIAGEEFGGGQRDFIGAAIVAEEIGKVCTGTYTSTSGHVLAVHWIDAYGRPEQKARYLPRLVTAEALAGIAITEPEAGSDVAALRTAAVRAGDCFLVNGGKVFITNGSVAEVLVCLVRTGGAGAKGLSTLIVETCTPGFSASRPLEKCGNRCSPTAEISFRDCRVPAANLLGGEGEGFKQVMQLFAFERALVGVVCGALCEAALEQAVRYCRERRQFGQALIEFQMVQQLLAEMTVDLQATKSLTRDLLRQLAAGADAGVAAAITKIFSAEAVQRVTSNAVQLLGGYGYTREFPAERWYRDAKLFAIGGGTTQIQKLIVARALA